MYHIVYREPMEKLYPCEDLEYCGLMTNRFIIQSKYHLLPRRNDIV